MLPAATPQDPSIEQNIDNLDGPPDLQSYIYSDHFKHEYCDFDSITVAETPTRFALNVWENSLKRCGQRLTG